MKILKTLLSIALGLGFLFLALRRVEWENLRAIMEQSNFFFAAAGGIFIIMGLAFKGLRIAWISQGNARRLDIYAQGVVLGLGINSLIPLRAGEAAKIVYLSRETEIGFLKAGLLVAAERVLDFCSLGALMAAAFFMNGPLFGLWLEQMKTYSNRSGSPVFWLALLLPALLLLVAGLFALNAWNFRSRFEFYRQVLRDRLAELLIEFRGRIGVSLGFSIAAWTCDIAFLGFLVRVFHLPLGLGEILFLQMVLSLAYVSSVSPGALGIYELLGGWTLAHMGVRSDQSLVFLLSAHALSYAIMLLGAAIALMRAGWTSQTR